MRHCDHCGAQIGENDVFCSACGANVGRTVAAVARHDAHEGPGVCPNCGSEIDATMRFCQNCGELLGTRVVIDDIMQAAENVGTAPIVPPVMPPDHLPIRQGPKPAASRTSSRIGSQKIWVVAMAVLLAMAVLAAGLWWFVFRPQATLTAGLDRSGGSVQQQGREVNGSAGKSNDPSSSAKTCATPPTAELASTDHDGDMLIAAIDVDTSCERSGAQFARSHVEVTIRNNNGVVAAAVFDFARQPIVFNGGHASIKLSYGLSQYWSPFDQIDASNAQVMFQAGEDGNGNALSAPDGAYAGRNVRDSDIERYAQTALTAQISHDSSEASGLDNQYTTQLSSKKYGLQAEGKTWHYRDIDEQFIHMRIQHSNAILIWAADHSNYLKDGNPADYYVVLSGERFSSVDDAKGWCSSNGYSGQDCIAVQLW